MLQPTGPHDGALLTDTPLVDALRVLKAENAFSPRLLPHLGHFNSTLAVCERTSFSYFWAQSWQTYS
jgi:hypothetical protein